MSAINISPESFYKGSVATVPEDISARVRRSIADGADFVDIGGMSTVPYLESEVSEEVEASRVKKALRAIAETEGAIAGRISVDTLRAHIADVALKSGASIINDVTGLKNDPEMAGVIRDHGASLLAMAHSKEMPKVKNPIVHVRHALKETLRMAESAGIDESRIVLDPGIGFFREAGAGTAYSPQKLMPWHEWDCEVLASLRELESLRRPLCVGLSRKSFLGKILGLGSPEERLSGSVAATAIAVMIGAHLMRTHDVIETVQSVKVAEAILEKTPSRRAGSVS